jgi:stress-induced morphogen
MAEAAAAKPTESSIFASLQAALKPEGLAVVDNSGGCGASFVILVVSEAFAGQLPLKKQRAVHDGIGPAMADIHAVEVTAVTKKQFDKKVADGKLPEALVSGLVWADTSD